MSDLGTLNDSLFDLAEIPFSRRGSWLDLSPVVAAHTRARHVHLVSHRTGMHAVLGIIPQAGGSEIETRVEARPWLLRWIAESGTIEAVFEGDDTVRMRGAGLSIRLADAVTELTPFTGAYLFVDPRDDAAVITSYETGHRYRVTVLRGERRVLGAGALGRAERAIEVAAAEAHGAEADGAAVDGAAVDGAAGWEIAIEEIGTARPPYTPRRSFDEAVADVRLEFEEYARALAPWAERNEPPAHAEEPASRRAATARTAAYVLWSATVAPAGFIGREAVLMSKHWMDKVWSWDHCFNAIALAASHPRAALDQFLLPFDHQDDSGALPDSITHSERLYNYVKPPIHGWALLRLRERLTEPLTASDLRTVYTRLADWTRFWLDARRAPGSPLPFYQHGNDSGWDNATTFDRDRVIVSPDLAAFLVIQLRVLADLADELDIAGSSWAAEADELEEALYTRLWQGDRFIARTARGDEPAGGESLLTWLPIILGERLRPGVAAALEHGIRARLTEWGPATEPVDSPAYESDGYWRGPIWAPSTALVEDGARRAGLTGLADEIRERFLTLCERSGFAENFDAVTGAGLRDRAYTWTASVYLAFAAADAADREREVRR